MMPRSTESSVRLAFTVLVCALFCSIASAGAAQERNEAEPAKAPPTEDDVPVCDGPLKLGATFYMNDRPEQSLAMLRTPKTPTAGLYRRGMYIEGYLVIAVEPRGVLLARDDAYCWLRLQPDPTRPAAQPPPPRKAKAKAKRKR